jgi:hypothetical protein
VGEKLDCENWIGRRIRLRDLLVFLTVSQRGSMAQAAAQLGVSQPAVSGVIAELEQTLGVPLFGAVRIAVGIWFGAISDNMKVPAQAARSIG